MAQPVQSEKSRAQHFYTAATELMAERQFAPARKYLEKAIDSDPKFAYAYLKMAEINGIHRENAQHIFNLKKFADLAPQSPERNAALLRLGIVYQDSGYYQRSAEVLHTLLADTAHNKDFIARAKIKLEGSNFAIEGMKRPVRIKPEALPNPLNAFPLQYFPCMTADKEQIFFTARKGSNNAEDDENLYTSAKRNGLWEVPHSVGSSINTFYNEGTASVSADGRLMVFAAAEGHEGKGGVDLFISRKLGEEWEEPENLVAINSNAFESQPSLSADGNTIYFVSDRPGGFGRYDIWVSRRENEGKWGVPKNLGPVINTPDAEFGPFIHGNGQTLFFSSSGHPGYGGQDLYFSQFNFPDSTWSKPVNLGFPVNTHRSESSIFVSADGKDALFNIEDRDNHNLSTSRIFRYEVPNEWKPAKVCTYVKGIVTDEITKKPLEAEVELINAAGSRKVYSVMSDSLNGNYLMVVPSGGNYGLYVNKKGYLIRSFNLDAAKPGKLGSMSLNIPLSPIKAGSKAGLHNIFFETNKSTLLPESKAELDILVAFLAENPGLHIEIGGHTDDVGSDAENVKLSEARAKSVSAYLVQNKIAGTRLSVKGYGKAHPISSKTDEVSRKMNRRTEFKIISLK
ncbi:MAG: OmpA family protein [Bacteroidota bacterium]